MNEKEYNVEIGMRIKNARKAQKITLKELGSSVGISESTTKRYEDGQIKGVDVNIIKKFANALSVSPAWLMGYDDIPAAPRKKGVKIPVLGSIVAGAPEYTEANILGWFEIPTELAEHGDYYMLKVHGMSMSPDICDGDYILVRHQQTAHSGDICVININGDECTVKEIQIKPEGVMLIGYNQAEYKPTFYSNEEVKRLPLLIQGVVIQCIRKYKEF